MSVMNLTEIVLSSSSSEFVGLTLFIAGHVGIVPVVMSGQQHDVPSHALRYPCAFLYALARESKRLEWVSSPQ